MLKAADRAARRLKINRSDFIRQAMRAHLRGPRVRDREDADRRGYGESKESAAELAAWDRVAPWPEE